MPEVEFDGHTLRYDGQSLVYGASDPDRPDTAVVVSEYELRTLASFLPETRALPISVRGDELVIMPGPANLPTMVELCRMRDVRDAPRYPKAPEGASDAQEATGPQEPAATLARPALDEALQARFEAFLSNIGVDPAKWDHQNLAGELVDGVMSQLRERGVLNAWHITRDWYLSNQQSVRAAVARGVSRASLSSLNEAARIGQLVQEEMDGVFESRDPRR